MTLFDQRSIRLALILLVASCYFVFFGGIRPVQAAGGRAATVLSSDTVAYVRIENVADLGERLQDFSIARALRDPEVAPLFEQLYGGSVGVAINRFEDESGLSIEQTLAAVQGELIVGLVALPAFKPALVFMFQAADDLDGDEAATEVLKVGRQALEEGGFRASSETLNDISLTILKRNDGPIQEVIQMQLGEWQAITTQRRVAEQLIAIHLGGDVPTLDQHPPFRTIRTRCAPAKNEDGRRPEPQIEWYVDPIAMARSFLRGNLGATVGLAILPAIGADGIQAIGGTASMANDQYDVILRTHLLLEPPRSGVTEMFAIGQGSTQPEAWVPSDVAMYTTWHIEPSEMYTTLEELIDSVRSEGTVANFVEKRFSEPLGVDFKQDLLDSLTGRITYFTQFERPVRVTSQANVVGFELKDPLAFLPKLETVVAKWSDRFEKSSFGEATIYRIVSQEDDAEDDQPRDADDAQINGSEDASDEEAGSDRQRRRRRARRRRQQMRQAAKPALAILGESLVVTDRVSALEQAVMTRSNVGTRLRDELDFKLVASKLTRHSSSPLGMLRFERPDEGLRLLYDLVRSPDVREQIASGRGGNPFLEALHQAIENDQFPPFEVISKYLAPTGSMLSNEETGLHYVAFGLKLAE